MMCDAHFGWLDRMPWDRGIEKDYIEGEERVLARMIQKGSAADANMRLDDPL
jgi:hypothetical protein